MKDCTDSEFDYFKSHVDLFRLISLCGIEGHECQMMLETLKEVFTFMSYLEHKKMFDELKRVTINRSILNENKRITKVCHLKYPPSKYVKKYGRANLIGQSVLYATFDALTTLNEMKPSLGDLICISTWGLREDQPLLFTPIFKRWQLEDGAVNLEMKLYDLEYQKLLNTYPENLSRYIDLNLDFIAGEFEKPVDRANPENYLLSAFFANQILYDYPTTSGDKFDAILYPSVASNRDFNNIAIKPEIFDELYKLQEVKECVVIGIPDRAGSGYMLDVICDSQSIDEKNDEVVWKKQFYQPKDRIEALIRKHDLKF